MSITNRARILGLILCVLLPSTLTAAKHTTGGSRGKTGSPSITTVNLPDGTVGVAYSQTLAATGGTPSYVWTSTALPAGLTLNASTAVLAGTPTVAALYSFTVTVTDATSKTYSQALSLYIAPSGGTSVLSLSSTSLNFGGIMVGSSAPPQIVTVSNVGTLDVTISSIVAASPFSDTPTCGGTLPAQTSCAVSVTFTPLSAGSLTDSITITDSAAGSPHSVSLVGTGIVSPPLTLLFQSSHPTSLSDFSTLNCGASNVNCVISSTVQHNGTDTLQIHYVCSTPPCDVNRWVDVGFAEQPGVVYARGYVYIDSGGQTQDTGVQRKLMWMDDGNGGTFDWSMILVAWWEVDGKLHISASPNVASPCHAWADYNLATLNFDTWYSIELGFQPDTGGLSNGQYKVWVNGTQMPPGAHATGACVRGSNATGIKSMSWGRQTDTITTPVSEFRYWDNMTVSSTGPIGP